jgi:hypothetical protein
MIFFWMRFENRESKKVTVLELYIIRIVAECAFTVYFFMKPLTSLVAGVSNKSMF